MNSRLWIPIPTPTPATRHVQYCSCPSYQNITLRKSRDPTSGLGSCGKFGIPPRICNAAQQKGTLFSKWELVGSKFWVVSLRTGIGGFTKMAPHFVEKMNLDYCSARVDVQIFQKMGSGASGDKKKDRRRGRSGKNTGTSFGRFSDVSRDQIIRNSVHSTRMIFQPTSRPPNSPC